MLNDMPDIMNVKQLQYALHIGRSSAYKLLKSNQIEHFFIGRSIRILKKSVVEFVCTSSDHYDIINLDESVLACREKGVNE